MFEVPLDTPAPSPTSAPTPPPTPVPALPAPDFHGFNHGVALLGGWFPLTVEIVAVVLLIAVIGWRTRRWRLVWLPVSAAVGAIGALAARGYVNSQSLPSDPAPPRLWVWVGTVVFAIAIAVLGWRTAAWWRRGLSLLVMPLALAVVLLVANQWLSYYRTLPAAWDALSGGPLPDEVDTGDLGALRNSAPSSGKLVQVSIPDGASGFKHRPEYVYLPPARFAGATPLALPAVMMIADGSTHPPSGSAAARSYRPSTTTRANTAARRRYSWSSIRAGYSTTTRMCERAARQ
jgi:hypothetical protein